MKIFRIPAGFGATLAVILLMGAGPCGTGEGASVLMRYAYVDTEKWITPTITDGADPLTTEQPAYRIGPTERVLLRWNTLVYREPKIVLSDQYRVEIQLPLKNVGSSNGNEAKDLIELCPLDSDWSSMATWDQTDAQTDVDWQTPGGNFSTSDCIRAQSVSTWGRSVELKFDVTDWFVSRVRNSQRNLGFVLTSTATGFEVQSEGASSARMNWLESP